MGYNINWEDKGVFVVFNETATGKEVIKIDDILYSHDNFERYKYQLWDFSEAIDINFTDEEMEIIGVLDKAASVWNKSMFVGIISTHKEFRESIEIYKKEIADIGWVCELFEDKESARKYINEKFAL